MTATTLDTPHSGGRRRVRQLGQWVVLGLPPVVMAILGWTHRTMVDDGYIYLRIVNQLDAGNGPVFNVGERVEAYTGPLWVAVLWVGDVLLPLDLAYVAVVLGIIGTATGLCLGLRGSCRLVRSDHPDALLVPVGLVVLVGLLPMWYFQTTGLELGLAFAWLGASFAVLVTEALAPRRRFGAHLAVLLGLGWLVRPELAVFSVLFLLVVLRGRWSQEGWPGRVRIVAWAVALPALYQVFRMAYFGMLVANTAVAKEASATRWDVGWAYLMDLVRPYWLLVPLVALAIGAYLPLLRDQGRAGRRGTREVIAAFVIGGTATWVYVIAIGGDYFHARLLLPGLVAYCLPVAVVPLTRTRAVSLLVVLWALIAAIGLRPPQATGVVASEQGAGVIPGGIGRITVEDWEWGPGQSNQAWYQGPATYYTTNVFGFGYERLWARPAPEVDQPTLMLYAIGLPGYALDEEVYVFDALGLADPITGHFRLDRRGLPGHEKDVPPPWAVGRLVAAGDEGAAGPLLVAMNRIVGDGGLVPYPRDADELRAQATRAREVMTCAPVTDLLAAAREPLDAGRVIDNILGSVRRTTVRIPAPVDEAAEELCP